MKFDLSKLYKQEIMFPGALAEVVNRKYGMLFYNKSCQLSYDTNHAVITDLNCDLDAAIKDILSFYNSRQVDPRIYFAFIPGELKILKPYIDKYGFEIGVCEDTSFFIYRQEQQRIEIADMEFIRLIEPDPDVDEVLMSGTEEVPEVIESGFCGQWWVTFMHNALKVDHIHMLVGYIKNKPVTIASVNIMEGYSRVDDVKTHSEFWNKGYSSALMSYLVKYHMDLSDNELYLFAQNPTAIRVYEKVGFERIPDAVSMWSAYITK